MTVCYDARLCNDAVDLGREEHYSRKAELVAVMSSPEARLGTAAASYSAALRRLADVGEVVHAGDPTQQRKVLGWVFDRVELSVER